MSVNAPPPGRTLCDDDHIASQAGFLSYLQRITTAIRVRRRSNEEFRMQPRSKEFRAHAAECRELARRIRDPEVKRQYEELARQWVELAEQAERRCDRPAGAGSRRN